MARPPSPPPPGRPRHLRAGDLRALAQLATQATLGVIGITEGVHQAVRHRVGLPAGAAEGRTGGLTGRVYGAVRGVAHGLGSGIDGALRALLPLLDRPAEADPAALRLQRPTPHLLLMLHGLCMNDLQWRRGGHDHTEVLAQALQATPVHLRYNSGLPIAANGRALAERLERLLSVWPAALQGITLVGHSMGGLLARSAMHAGQRAGHRWPHRVRHLVFLGTPHHGAPLERAGHGADLLLASSPFSAPLARLGRLRSAGITDLRHGQVRAADEAAPEAPLPLPEGVACLAVAACLASRRDLLADRLVGDGLVPLRSALGEHDDPARRLAFARGNQRVVYRTGHLDLLSSPAVADQLRRWLAPPDASAG